MDEILKLTELLRKDGDALWKALRNQLDKENIDINFCFLAFSVEQGSDSEFGIIVDTNKDVYKFAIILNHQNSCWEFLEWNNVTTTINSSPYKTDVNNTFEIIDRESKSNEL